MYVLWNIIVLSAMFMFVNKIIGGRYFYGSVSNTKSVSSYDKVIICHVLDGDLFLSVFFFRRNKPNTYLLHSSTHDGRQLIASQLLIRFEQKLMTLQPAGFMYKSITLFSFKMLIRVSRSWVTTQDTQTWRKVLVHSHRSMISGNS